MTYYQAIEVIMKIVIIVALLYTITYKRKYYEEYSLYIFFTIGATICFDFRLLNAVSIVQIILSLLSIYYIDKVIKRTKVDKKTKALNSITILYIIYMGLMTIIWYIPISDYILKGSILQNELRPIVQIVQMVVTYLAFLSITLMPSKFGEKALKYFFRALVFFSIIGLIQGAIYYLIGFDIIPMRKDFVSTEHGLSSVTKSGMLRITAGIGEPKHYAKFMNIGLTMILLIPEVIEIKKGKNILKLLFILSIIGTFSTTGYLIMIVSIAFYIIKVSRYNIIKSMGILTIFTLIIVPILANSPVIKDKIENQTHNGGEIMGLENSDSAALKHLLNEPIYSITGTGIANTVGYANTYAPQESLFINFYPYTLRRGIIKVLAEGGIIGLSIVLIIFNIILSETRKNRNINLFALFIMLMFLFLTCESVIEIQMLILAILFRLSNKYKKEG